MTLPKFVLNGLWKSGAKNYLAKALAIAGLLGIGALGTTLAANINLNGGDNVEFGQGVAQTTACDNSIIITPSSTFINSNEAGDFYFTSLAVSDISSACFGKMFSIKAYKDGQSSPLNIYQTNGSDDYSEIKVYDNSGTFSLVDAGLLEDDIVDITNGFSITFTTLGPPPSVAVALAKNVDRITVQSTDSVPVGSMSFSNNLIWYGPNSDFALGLNDFTIETWLKTSDQNAGIYDSGESVNDIGGFAFWIEASSVKYRINGYGGSGYDISYPMTDLWNEWHHYAVSRTAGILRMFVDGHLVASSYDSSVDPGIPTSVNTIDLTRNDPAIGGLIGFGTGYAFDGNISSLRVVKGTALYTGDFTPPSRLVNVPGALLVLNSESEGALFRDFSSYNWTPTDVTSAPQWSSDHP